MMRTADPDFDALTIDHTACHDVFADNGGDYYGALRARIAGDGLWGWAVMADWGWGKGAIRHRSIDAALHQSPVGAARKSLF
jgi:hypothetical protein